MWLKKNHTNFCDIEFCCLEVSKLYLELISNLKLKFIDEGSTLDKVFSEIDLLDVGKHTNFREDSEYNKYISESNIKVYFSNLFKHCENGVREYYGHKRKVNTDIIFSNAVSKTEYEKKIIIKVFTIRGRRIIVR